MEGQEWVAANWQNIKTMLEEHNALKKTCGFCDKLGFGFQEVPCELPVVGQHTFYCCADCYNTQPGYKAHWPEASTYTCKEHS